MASWPMRNPGERTRGERGGGVTDFPAIKAILQASDVQWWGGPAEPITQAMVQAAWAEYEQHAARDIEVIPGSSLASLRARLEAVERERDRQAGERERVIGDLMLAEQRARRAEARLAQVTEALDDISRYRVCANCKAWTRGEVDPCHNCGSSDGELTSLVSLNDVLRSLDTERSE
jgi:hypothetical protein